MYKIGDKISSEKLYSNTKMIGQIINIEYGRFEAQDIISVKWDNGQIAKFYAHDLAHNNVVAQ